MLSDETIGGLLGAGETARTCVQIAGFHASKHDAPGASAVVLSSTRYVVVSERGAFKKRHEVAAAWPLAGFTERLNSNEGTALGPFLYFATLFTHDDETVSAAFKTMEQREQFKAAVVEALAAVNGW